MVGLADIFNANVCVGLYWVSCVGIVVLSDRKLYFQPLYNIAPVPVQKWAIGAISTVVKRRHLLRRCGLEVFLSIGADSHSAKAGWSSSVFFSFRDEAMRDRFYRHLITATTNSSARFGTTMSRGVSDVFLKDLTEIWMRGNLSNYDYLMALNSIADRSFKGTRMKLQF